MSIDIFFVTYLENTLLKKVLLCPSFGLKFTFLEEFSVFGIYCNENL